MSLKIYVYFLIKVCVINVLLTFCVNCSKNELFASLLELEVLWQNDIEIIGVMKRVVERWEDSPQVLKL